MRSGLLRARRVARAATAAVLLVGCSLTVMVAASTNVTARTATRAVTLSKTTLLRNEVVTVSWSGFHPTNATTLQYQVEILECIAAPVNLDSDPTSAQPPDQCYYAQPYPDSAGGNLVQTGLTDAHGNGTAQFEVRTDSQPLGSLACNFSTPCSIVVYELDFNPIPTNALPPSAVVTAISFAPQPTDCSGSGHFDLRGDGESSSAQQTYAWAGQACTGADAVSVDYTATSSNLGREAWLDPTSQLDFATTSLPFTSDELAAAPKHLPFAYAPLDLNAVVVAFNVADPITQRPITSLTLSPRLVARLMTGSQLDTFFQDPELVALNPGVRFPPQAISPLARADLNADTHLFTDWMIHDADAQKLVAGNDIDGIPVTNAYKNYPYPVDIWKNEANDTFQPLTNNDVVASYAFRGRPAIDGVYFRPWTAGYFAILDLPTAARFGLPLAKLVNASGNAVAPDAAGILAAYHDMNVDVNGFRTPDFTTTDPAAYPLAKIDYAVVPTVGVDDDLGNQRYVPDDAKIAHFKTFLDYVTTTGQQDPNLLPGFVPLPSELVAQTQSVADSIKHFDAPPVPPTTTTTVPPSTSTTTTAPLATDQAQQCCSSSGNDVSGDIQPATSVPRPRGVAGGTTPPTPRVTTPSPVEAPQAPAWLPIASMASSPSGLGLLVIFGLGITTLLARVGWLILARALAARAAKPRVPKPPPPPGEVVLP